MICSLVGVKTTLYEAPVVDCERRSSALFCRGTAATIVTYGVFVDVMGGRLLRVIRHGEGDVFCNLLLQTVCCMQARRLANQIRVDRVLKECSCLPCFGRLVVSTKLFAAASQRIVPNFMSSRFGVSVRERGLLFDCIVSLSVCRLRKYYETFCLVLHATSVMGCSRIFYLL